MSVWSKLLFWREMLLGLHPISWVNSINHSFNYDGLSDWVGNHAKMTKHFSLVIQLLAHMVDLHCFLFCLNIVSWRLASSMAGCTCFWQSLQESPYKFEVWLVVSGQYLHCTFVFLCPDWTHFWLIAIGKNRATIFRFPSCIFCVAIFLHLLLKT